MQQKDLTWNAYKNSVSELVKGKKSYYCRGHAHEGWKLRTSFHREAGRNGTNLLQYLDEILPEVHYHITAVRDEIIDLREEEEFGAFLALIQHHGFPTPLLDWSLSPYVAAYFAFKEVNDQSHPSENAKIYFFDYLEWKRTFKQPHDLRDMINQYVSVIRPHARFNKRIIPQQGAFTVTNVDDMEAYISARSGEAGRTFLQSLLISVKEKPDVMRELNLMGINERTLFPGVGGICRAFKSQCFSADTVGPTLKELLEAFGKSRPESSIAPQKI